MRNPKSVYITANFVPFSEERLPEEGTRSLLGQAFFHIYWTECYVWIGFASCIILIILSSIICFSVFASIFTLCFNCAYWDTVSGVLLSDFFYNFFNKITKNAF